MGAAAKLWADITRLAMPVNVAFLPLRDMSKAGELASSPLARPTLSREAIKRVAAQFPFNTYRHPLRLFERASPSPPVAAPLAVSFFTTSPDVGGFLLEVEASFLLAI